MNDALKQVVRPLRGDRLVCDACGARWRVRRAVGDTFYLRWVAAGRVGSAVGGAASVPAVVGDELPIHTWYELMKQTVRLLPLDDPTASLPAGETLYLRSGPAELHVEEGDPLFFPAAAAPSRVDKRQVRGVSVGQGQLLLSDRRLIWQGSDEPRSFPLAQLNSAYAVMDIALALLVGMRLVTVRFGAESLLKWVTLIALVGREKGLRIETSHF